MINHLRHYLLSACMVAGLTTYAIPAKRQPMTVTQPDGSTITIMRTGDEHRHFTTTTDGLLLTRTADGYYDYARIAVNGTISSTGVRAADPAKRITVPAGTMTLSEAVEARRAISTTMRRAPQTGMGLYTTQHPTKGDVNALVLLVEYSDVKFNLKEKAHDYFTNMLTQEGFSEYNGTGSAKDYFRDNSNGQFRPNFEVFGPITLDHPRAYYGGNDSYGDDLRPDEMIADACRKADAEIDFSRYDMDNDGYVDNVFVFYAGEGENNSWEEDAVWPHSWEIQSTLKLDGKIISRYACSNEWYDNEPEGIGTFVHEYSHVLGLPDLYSTSTDLNCTPDSYCVMDMGPYNNNGRTPPVYSVFERNAVGWIDVEVIDGPMVGRLENIGDSNHAYLIPTNLKNEFFLLENRQQTGWDKYIPGHGMLVWHIDFQQAVWDLNQVNNTRRHQFVDIVEANNNPNSSNESNMAGYTYPGTSNNTSLTDDTTPSMRTWADMRINLPITDIKEVSGVITFKVGGASVLSRPEIDEEIEVGEDYFVASWSEVDKATDYLLSVYEAGEGEPVTITQPMGQNGNLNLGQWTSSSSDSYKTNTNFGESAPSLKLATDGAWLESPELPSDLTSISFWHKGMNSDSSFISVYCYKEGEWFILAEVTPTSNKADTFTCSDIPGGVSKVKLVYNKSMGNVGIDDIVLTCGPSDKVLEGFNRISTGGSTSKRVDIPATCKGKTFRFTVTATDGTEESKVSATKTVNLGESGIEGITAVEAPAEWYDLAGRRILHPSKGDIVIERRGTKVRKLIVR